MTAADRREELEAVIWRERGGDPRRPAQDVDRILTAADAYARRYAIDEIARMTPVELTARLRLAEATAERTGRPA